VGTNVVSDLQMDASEIGYRYDLCEARISCRSMFQINLIDFDVYIHDQPQTQKADEDQIVPLPMIGLHGEFFPHPRFGVFGEVKGFTIGDTASMVDLEVGAQINVLKNFSIVGGYRYMYFDFDVSDVEGDITIDGPSSPVRISLIDFLKEINPPGVRTPGGI
jgi:opacity protein-like surface antigen